AQAIAEVCYSCGTRLERRFRQQNCKLIAPEPPDQIGSPARLLQRRAEPSQDAVSGVVSETIVDSFEIGDVHIHNGKTPPSTSGSMHFFVCQLIKPTSVQ